MKKRNLTVLLIALMITPVFFTGCKKYTDGPMLSLRTKKARVANTWVIEQYIVNGQDETSSMTSANYVETFKKDGTYTLTYSVSGFSGSDNGTWAFTSGKKEITMQSSASGSSPSTLVILKLKNKSFWFDETDPNSGDLTEVHLKQK